MEQGSAGGIGYLAGCWPPDPAKSTLFFIHGAGGSSLFWQAQVEGLAQRVNTIALDRPKQRQRIRYDRSLCPVGR